ncbi:hypothetical protein QQP08_014365 [Theobroma cacao]|nr:hypothetical protein QQP08_014365 [Theobroma cacao]
MKQCKLDVRREQWLSQGCNAVKNEESKVDLNGGDGSSPFSTKRADNRNKSLHNLGTKSREGDSEDMSIHDSDLESLMNSPIPSDLGHNDSREALSRSSCSGSSTGSSTSSGFCSGSVSEEEEDGCLDNWEDVADALSVDDNQHNPATVTPSKYETRIESACADQHYKNQRINQLNSDSEGTVCGSQMNCRAWRPEDAFRPRILPSLSKQHNILLIQIGMMAMGLSPGHSEVLFPTLLHALFAVRIWMSQTLAFSLVHVDFGFASSVTKGFLKQMGNALDVGNIMIPLMGIYVSVDELHF